MPVIKAPRPLVPFVRYGGGGFLAICTPRQICKNPQFIRTRRFIKKVASLKLSKSRSQNLKVPERNIDRLSIQLNSTK